MTGTEGVNIAGVTVELEAFVREASPINGSGDGLITTMSYARCGRSSAIAFVERVRPILDRLYPEWRDENPPVKSFEFASEHDASQRLLERLRSSVEIDALLGADDSAPRLDAGSFHHLVWRAASAQWSTGHLQEAVLAASKAVNSLLQSKLGRRDISEARLVQEAFSEKPSQLGAPRLRFSMIGDDQTRASMREGVLSFGVGCFRAIRNPVGHLPNEEVELSEQQALERLAAWSLLARWIDEAELVTVDDVA